MLMARDVRRVAVAHGGDPLRRVAVEQRDVMRIEERQQVLHERLSAGHPLVVVPATVVIEPIQKTTGESLGEPREYGLVTHVHTEGDLRLLAVAAERSLPDQEPDQQSPIEIRKLDHARGVLSRICFTVKKNVKHPPGRRGRPAPPSVRPGAQSTSGATTRRRDGSWPSL